MIRCQIKPFIFSAAIVVSSRFRSPPKRIFSSVVAAMSTTSSTTTTTCNGGKSAIIFLHGLGDSPAGWSSLEYDLPEIRKRLGEGVQYIFPPAPTIGLSINGGAKMPGWFDLYDWPIDIDATDDRDGKLAAVKQIEDTVVKLEKDEGIPPNRVVIGGFSQGGAVALLAAYHQRKLGKVPFAGCVCLSGWLTLKEDLTISDEVAKATPLFWGHGQFDDKVLFEQQSHGVGKLRELGVDVTDGSYPMGHSSHPKEMNALAEFLEKVLFP